MFQAKAGLFINCMSPLHVGAETAVGLIDNPIQRERHTEHPMIAGSGLKGAVRHHLQSGEWNREQLDRTFGPENSAHAGAVSFGDAQLVLFPVRCTRSAYAYATSALALARARRLLEQLECDVPWTVPQAPRFDDTRLHCGVVPGSNLVHADVVDLELYQYAALRVDALGGIARWLADHALPAGEEHEFFKQKVRDDLILLPDEDFSYFVRHATVVEPHVRINITTGAADSGGLFYTENLPPESLLLCPLMASRERTAEGAEAKKVLRRVLQGEEGSAGLDGALAQIGGDSTTGRGLVVLKAIEGRTHDA